MLPQMPKTPEAEITALKHKIQKHEQRITSLEKHISTLATEITRLKADKKKGGPAKEK